MKKLLCVSAVLLVSVFLIFSCKSSSNNVFPVAAANFSGFPTATDGVVSDVTYTGATTVTLGTSYHRTLFPDGDVDFFKVHLVSGPTLTYEFSANQLSSNSDTFMFLYDTDGTTLLRVNDDCLDLDSCIQFQPSVDGDYYIKVTSYENGYYGIPAGVASYTFNAHLFVDNDGDNLVSGGSPTIYVSHPGSSYYDCNDNDPTIYPGAPEIAGDGISQNCSGVDALVGTTADSAEPDNSVADAKTLTVLDADPWEIIYRHDLFAQYGRTIAPSGDIDWFSVAVPAYTMIEVGGAYNQVSLIMTAYDTDGTTVVGSNSSSVYLTNTTAAAKTYYVTFAALNGTDTGYYVPYAVSYGTDKDGDGYYSQDWDTNRDCDDNDNTLYPGTGCGY